MLSRYVFRHETILALLLVLALALSANLSDRFFTVDNLLNQGRMLTGIPCGFMPDLAQIGPVDQHFVDKAFVDRFSDPDLTVLSRPCLRGRSVQLQFANEFGAASTATEP